MSELRVEVKVRYCWTEQYLSIFEALKAALIATAPPPITITLWRPAPPENRRLPMPLAYGNSGATQTCR